MRIVGLTIWASKADMSDDSTVAHYFYMGKPSKKQISECVDRFRDTSELDMYKVVWRIPGLIDELLSAPFTKTLIGVSDCSTEIYFSMYLSWVEVKEVED